MRVSLSFPSFLLSSSRPAEPGFRAVWRGVGVGGPADAEQVGELGMCTVKCPGCVGALPGFPEAQLLEKKGAWADEQGQGARIQGPHACEGRSADLSCRHGVAGFGWDSARLAKGAGG